MKNVMLLIASLKNGGAERSIANLAMELSKSNNVIMVVGNSKNRDYFTDVKVVEVRELCMKRRKIIGIYKVRKLKKKYKIDTAISYTTVFNFANVASHYKDKTIISIRNYLSKKKENKLANILHLISVKKCDLVVNVSNSVSYDQVVNYHVKPNKMVTIPNFVDLSRINKMVNESISDDVLKLLGKKTFITIGRLVEHKRQINIIHAIRKVVDIDKSVKLLIFGRGPKIQEINDLIHEMKLDNNVYIMGFDPNPYKYLNKCAALILASDFEGFPNVVIEAMASKCPVIATDCYGGSKEILMNNCRYDEKINDLIMGDYGILVPNFCDLINVDREEVLQSAILMMLDEKIQKYYKKQAQKRILKYTNDEVIQDWLKIL